MSRQEKDRPLAAVSHVLDYASIDIGSHTIRLLIARLIDREEVIPLVVERSITRLARDFQNGGTLKKPAVEESLHVLKGYASLMDKYQVGACACGATGVIRRAKNGNEFLHAIHEETGLRCSIISEESEALLSTKGVFSVLPHVRGSVLSFDLGGSSTEFTLSRTPPMQPLWNTSVFTGAATVTERYLSREDPPEVSSVAQARMAIREDLEPVISAVADYSIGPHGPAFTLVGTAGTVTTLAAMNLRMKVYEPYRVNGWIGSKNWIEETIDLLIGLPVAARRGIQGLEKGREDIILGGALIVDEILNGFKLDQLTVTDSGLLEGLLLDLMERENGWSQPMSTPLTWRMRKG